MNKRDFARQLRHRMTDAERLLGFRLRDRRFAGYKFLRQVPMGDYVVDFACHSRRLIVELDGGQHAARKAYDDRRDGWLERQGFYVLRFPDNLALKKWDSVLEVIWKALQEPRDSDWPG